MGNSNPHFGEGDRTILTKRQKFCVPPYVVCGTGAGPIVEGGELEVLSYLSCSEGVSCSTSSPYVGKLYFPSFLLGDGSVTQMYMASLMVLVIPCAFLATIVKHCISTDVLWSGCVGK